MNPSIVRCEDGSILIEWINDRSRFGISVELLPEETGWYFVAEDGMTQGTLPLHLANALQGVRKGIP